MAEFWASNDTVDFEDQTFEVEMEFEASENRRYDPIDPEILKLMIEIAQEKNTDIASLANLWLREKVTSK